MKTYSETILKAYEKYSKLLAKHNEGIDHVYGQDLAKKNRNINRVTDNFMKVCESEGFNSTQVAMDLTKF